MRRKNKMSLFKRFSQIPPLIHSDKNQGTTRHNHHFVLATVWCFGTEIKQTLQILIELKKKIANQLFFESKILYSEKGGVIVVF